MSEGRPRFGAAPLLSFGAGPGSGYSPSKRVMVPALTTKRPAARV
ncbi:MAG: hypothetical protein KatS3mg064_1481 [Tepidiforma sp.]|nr:MAG: hypothetical protein KatS3mg064_1481 [Tepidiforma sp.]